MYFCSPREDGATITFVLPSAASLGVSLQIRLHCILFRAFLTFPFLFAVFSEEVLLDASEISQCSAWIMVNTCDFWAYVYSFPCLNVCSLLELPWQVMTSAMELEVLVPLKAFVTYLANEAVPRH